MNREIKFRAWDTEENKFFEPVYEAYAGRLEDLSINFSGQLLRRTLGMPAENESRFPGRYIVMQYTGLKDKNGKEIYEGDIVQPLYKFKPIVVEFVDGQYPIREYNLKRCKVIGNIYEHPHLLEEEKK